MTDEDLDPEIDEFPPIPDEPEDDFDEPEPEKKTIKDMAPEEFLSFLEEQNITVKPSKRKRKEYSPYVISFPTFCKYYNMGFHDALKKVAEETDIEINTESRPPLRTAHSQVQKVVRYLRRYGHLPEDGEVQKKPAARKTTAKKAKEE
jgi:hypothetical protein